MRFRQGFFSNVPTACLFTDKPKLLSVTPGDITVSETDNVTLGAVVEGNPAPYVAWVSQKGSILQNKTEQFNYTITNMTREDRGKYQCVATSLVGEDTKDFVVSVKCEFNLVPLVDAKSLQSLLHSMSICICFEKYKRDIHSS